MVSRKHRGKLLLKQDAHWSQPCEKKSRVHWFLLFEVGSPLCYHNGCTYVAENLDREQKQTVDKTFDWRNRGFDVCSNFPSSISVSPLQLDESASAFQRKLTALHMQQSYTSFKRNRGVFRVKQSIVNKKDSLPLRRSCALAFCHRSRENMFVYEDLQSLTS